MYRAQTYTFHPYYLFTNLCNFAHLKPTRNAGQKKKQKKPLRLAALFSRIIRWMTERQKSKKINIKLQILLCDLLTKYSILAPAGNEPTHICWFFLPFNFSPAHLFVLITVSIHHRPCDCLPAFFFFFSRFLWRYCYMFTHCFLLWRLLSHM